MRSINAERVWVAGFAKSTGTKLCSIAKRENVCRRRKGKLHADEIRYAEGRKKYIYQDGSSMKDSYFERRC